MRNAITQTLFARKSAYGRTQPTASSEAIAKQQRDVRRDVLFMIALAIVAAALIALYLTLGLKGNIAYALNRRTTSVIALVLVAITIGVSTVIFQTVTANRLLTPSIMGFDSLYLLLQTSLVFVFGISGLTMFDTVTRFWVEVAAMLIFSALLYGWLLRPGAQVTKLLLVGVVFGMLFRGISSFMQRVLDPDAFAALQNRFFATFTDVPAALIVPATALTLVGLAITVWDRRRYDVMSLGRPIAVNLGIRPHSLRYRTLAATALLVSVATALVGPVMFFGLIVAQLAYRTIRVARHSSLLIAASLLGVIALVGGQVIVERVFALDVALSMIIEFLGGLLFLALILRKKPL